MAQHREFDREATVYVWRYKGAKHPGHAALKITGVPGTEQVYISWWPKGGLGSDNFEHVRASAHTGYKQDMEYEISDRAQERLNNRTWTLRPNQRLVRTETNGTNVYGTKADEVIKLPLQGAQGCVAGLDGAKIIAWWQIFKSSPHPQYKFASKNKNCSGVVAAALRVGGADQFSKAPSAMLFIDPNQIASWAKKVQKKLKKRNDAARNLAQQLGVTVNAQPTAPVTELMNGREWLELSNRNMPQGQKRSPQLHEIDRLLVTYYRYGGWVGPNIASKLIILGRLMDAIHTYLGLKSGGRRSDAIVKLGQQVLDVVRHRYEQAEEDDRLIVDSQSLWCKHTLYEEDPD